MPTPDLLLLPKSLPWLYLSKFQIPQNIIQKAYLHSLCAILPTEHSSNPQACPIVLYLLAFQCFAPCLGWSSLSFPILQTPPYYLKPSSNAISTVKVSKLDLDASFLFSDYLEHSCLLPSVLQELAYMFGSHFPMSGNHGSYVFKSQVCGLNTHRAILNK